MFCNTYIRFSSKLSLLKKIAFFIFLVFQFPLQAQEVILPFGEVLGIAPRNVLAYSNDQLGKNKRESPYHYIYISEIGSVWTGSLGVCI